MKEAGVVALVNVPIFVPGARVYGILQVDDTQPRAFGEDEIQFLRTYATILGPVIDRLHLVEERRASRERMFADLALAEGGFAISFKDFDQRKEAEMEFLRFISLLRTTFDNSLQFIQLFKAVRDENDAIVDFEWVLTNKQWNDRWGAMAGKRLLAHNPAVVESGVWNSFLQVMGTGEPVIHEHFYAHEQFDGWYLQTIAKAGDGILLSTLDVTEHRRTEYALSKSEEHYRLLFDSIDEGFLWSRCCSTIVAILSTIVSSRRMPPSNAKQVSMRRSDDVCASFSRPTSSTGSIFMGTWLSPARRNGSKPARTRWATGTASTPFASTSRNAGAWGSSSTILASESGRRKHCAKARNGCANSGRHRRTSCGSAMPNICNGNI